jgi:type II secretory pathway pseudopilin PulG
MNKKLLAFTMAEIIITLSMIAVLATLTRIVITKTTPEVYKLRTKQMNIIFKSALSNIVTDPLYYRPEGNLADLEEVTTDTDTYMGETKFRDIMFKEMGIDKTSKTNCEILTSAGAQESEQCYITENDVTIGIPPTDFVTKNLIRRRNAQGAVFDYLPITIYPNTSAIKKRTGNYMDEEAIFFGVRRDGAVAIISNLDCDDELYKNALQCRAADYIATLNIDFE